MSFGFSKLIQLIEILTKISVNFLTYNLKFFPKKLNWIRIDNRNLLFFLIFTAKYFHEYLFIVKQK